MTMKMRGLSLVLIIGLGLSLPDGKGDPAQAGKGEKEKAEEMAKAAEAKARAIELMGEAFKMAEFGKKNKSALTMVAAGALLLSLQGWEKSITENKVVPELVYEKDAEKG